MKFVTLSFVKQWRKKPTSEKHTADAKNEGSRLISVSDPGLARKEKLR